MARPNRDSYPPGDAGNKAFDDADFQWQMAQKNTAKQNVGGTGAYRAGVADAGGNVDPKAREAVAGAPIGDVSGLVTGDEPQDGGPTMKAILKAMGAEAGGIAGQVKAQKAFKIARQKWDTDPTFAAEWTRTHPPGADDDPTGELAAKANRRGMK